MLGAICRSSANAPRCAKLLELALSVQAFWQAITTFSLPKSQRCVERSRAHQHVLVRSGHGVGRARMRVP
eukprot:2748398-Prymnesium_polylepis.1